MGFWIYIFIMELLLPLTMIVLGLFFMIKPPKNINSWVGFRIAGAMKNKDTWEFANRYFGSCWAAFGFIMFLPTMLTMLLVMKQSEDMIGTVGLILLLVQLVFMLQPIFMTKSALKKEFDEQGIRKAK